MDIILKNHESVTSYLPGVASFAALVSVADCSVVMVEFFGGDDDVVNDEALGDATWFYTDDSDFHLNFSHLDSSFNRVRWGTFLPNMDELGDRNIRKRDRSMPGTISLSGYCTTLINMGNVTLPRVYITDQHRLSYSPELSIL